jgi:magnesium transporter
MTPTTTRADAKTQPSRGLLPDVQDALARNPKRVRDLLSALHPADIADLLLELPDEESSALFQALEGRDRVQSFEHLEPDQQESLLERLGYQIMVQVLDDMSSDDRADLFKHMHEEMRETWLPLLAQVERNDVKRLLEFPEGTAGSVMSTEYASVRPDLTVSQALEQLRRVAPKSETVYTVYVIAEDRRLVGAVSLLELITCPPGRRVEEVMRKDPVAVTADTDREDVARTVAKYDFLAIPVVDEEDRLLGIVTHDDVIDVLEAEHAEDVQLAAAIAPTEAPYTRASVRLLFRRRIVWLLALLVAGFLSSAVIAAFEASLEAVVALSFFIPVLIGSGGNTGSQSATLVIRAVATGDLDLRSWLRVLAKELGVGILLGSAMAAAVFTWSFLWPEARHVAPVVGLTMLVLVLWANLIGGLMPLLLRKIGIDPAVASAPLITTLVDATGLLIYFTIAAVVLGL